MQKKQVAVIDIGSSKISAIVGEKGINNTFVIKFEVSYDYEGFANAVFFDKEQVVVILKKISAQLLDFFHDNLERVYIGVPGAFTEVITKDCQSSFNKKRKITDNDVSNLFDSAFSGNFDKNILINRSSVFYELDDFRRLVNPIGSKSEILKARLSFITCDRSFTDFVEQALQNEGIKQVQFISSPFAQTLYLLEPDIRDRTAIVLDVGHISTTLFVVQGDGIVYMKSFDFGGGYISAELCANYDIPYEEAEKIKRKVNLSSFTKGGENYEILEGDNNDFFNMNDVKKIILSCLDSLCDKIISSFNEFNVDLPDYVSMMITGGGISYLRGAKEHVAGRINRSVQVIKPNLPLISKPTMSSILSVLNLSLEQ